MRISKHFMKGCYLLSALLMFFPIKCYATTFNKAFRSCINMRKAQDLSLALTHSDTIPLRDMGIVYALSIDATIQQPREASFVRIVLEDTMGHDYLVAESDRFRNDTAVVQLSQYCEETALLEGVVPARLKCYLTNASLQLEYIHTSAGQIKRGAATKAEMKNLKKAQVEDITDRINKYNLKHRKLWQAGVTNIALMNYSEKIKALGAKGDMSTNCIEYYTKGIFEFSSSIDSNSTLPVSPYISAFDWSNRHNKYWMTPIRAQLSTPYCTAFAVAAGIESMRNLYFNTQNMQHLSVQELACCAKFNPHPDQQVKINIDSALIYSRDNGVMLDSIYPFSENGLQICTSDEKNPDEIIKISDFTFRERTNVDSILKKDLINNGPQICWINAMQYFNHAMLLVGYGQIHEGMKLNIFEHFMPQEDIIIHEGDNRIGKTYWKFKNSWGLSMDNGYEDGTYDGYMYILMRDPSIIYKHYSILTPITSQIMSETDIVCEDNDGDGLFNWGIGSKPEHCPKWASEESDGDDSDWTKGHMNQYGMCEVLPYAQPIYQYISNDSTLLTSESRTKSLGIIRGATVTLQSQQIFSNGAKLLLDTGTTLILDGITIGGSTLQPYMGSRIILNNGAKITKPFEVPLGVELLLNKGSIE